MDLSVLEGNDPAGYRAEKKIQDLKKRAEDPFSFKSKRSHNPGSSFASDVVQRSSYRRNRQKDLDRLNFEAKKRQRENKALEYQEGREQVAKALEEKTAKRRLKRQAKKAKKSVKRSDDS